MPSELAEAESPSGAVMSGAAGPDCAARVISCGIFFPPRMPPRVSSRTAQPRSPGMPAPPIFVSSLDGPPVQDPEVWIPLHRKYWNGLLAAYGRECSDDMPVLIEPFDYVGEVI